MEAYVFETDLGFISFARENGDVVSLTFGHASEGAAKKAIQHRLKDFRQTGVLDFFDPTLDALVDRLRCFAEGESIDFDDVVINSEGKTTFQRRVLAACRAISYGNTATYGELAAKAGRPGAARAVGSVMAQNRVPLIVPCHRIVPASGKLGGFSAPQGVRMKQRLLDMEQCVGVEG